MRKTLSAIGALLIVLGSISSTQAASISFMGTSGAMSAQADFKLSGSTLTVTLTNTSATDVLVPGDVLTGVFFNTTHTLTAASASLKGSTVHYGSLIKDVGEGWQYLNGVNAQGMNSGISTVRLGVFGPVGNFFSPAVALGGLDYGILSAGDDLLTGNSEVTGHGPLIKNSIEFTLSVKDFNLSELGDTVVFQYGTMMTEPNYCGALEPLISPNPEPATLTLAGIGVAGLLAYRRRCRKLAASITKT